MFEEKNIKISAIISEYNPFHCGHKFHIESTRKQTDSDYIIVLMSGDFVQRGGPAIIDKFTRTKMALLNGADLVLELPVIYSTASAEGFSKGAVSILDRLNCVDFLSFGSECDDIEAMKVVAKLLLTENEKIDSILRGKIKEGLSYPKARELAYATQTNNPSILSSPNNILGIEYIKALLSIDSNIKPFTIKRNDNGFNNVNLDKDSLFSSATSIRNAIFSSDKNYKNYIPENTQDLIDTISCIDDYSDIFYYKILTSSKEDLCSYLDVSEDIANRFINNINKFKNISSYIELIKTKNWTYSRISRCIFHIILNIKSKDLTYTPEYVRILGFKKEKSDLLGIINENSSINIISKLADAPLDYSLSKDIKSSDLYCQVNNTHLNEYSRQIIII